MKRKLRFKHSALVWAMMLFAAYAVAAHAQGSAKDNQGRPSDAKKRKAPASKTDVPVKGSGTVGQLTKWTGTDGGHWIIGDSIITESNDQIGIGTTAPTSKLTVQGIIESTLGGYKFPDGTVQTTAAGGLSSIFRDATLVGDGTNGSPLGVAVPLSLSGATSDDGAVIRATNTGGGVGVEGISPFVGVRGESPANIGVLGSSASGVGLFGQSLNGIAGFFSGDVQVLGMLSKSGGSFKIDHPLDPENKYLYHSFVESPDMKNIYDGVSTLDGNGEAVVVMPEWFEALNKDFRYLLTPIGAPGPTLYIAQKMADNRFKIAGGQAGMEVSWQVTGIRRDAYANAHRIPVEEKKAGNERGRYLHPEAFGQPEEKSIRRANYPEVMKQDR